MNPFFFSPASVPFSVLLKHPTAVSPSLLRSGLCYRGRFPDGYFSPPDFLCSMASFSTLLFPPDSSYHSFLLGDSFYSFCSMGLFPTLRCKRSPPSLVRAFFSFVWSPSIHSLPQTFAPRFQVFSSLMLCFLPLTTMGRPHSLFFPCPCFSYQHFPFFVVVKGFPSALSRLSSLQTFFFPPVCDSGRFLVFFFH